jgi:hypothetical protein
MVLAGITRHKARMTQNVWNSGYLHPVKWDQHFVQLALHDMFFQSAERTACAAIAVFMDSKHSVAW